MCVNYLRPTLKPKMFHVPFSEENIKHNFKLHSSKSSPPRTEERRRQESLPGSTVLLCFVVSPFPTMILCPSVIRFSRPIDLKKSLLHSKMIIDILCQTIETRLKSEWPYPHPCKSRIPGYLFVLRTLWYLSSLLATTN